MGEKSKARAGYTLNTDMAPIFDPTEFFEKSAYFASQGRGLFTIPALPPLVLTGNDSDREEQPPGLRFRTGAPGDSFIGMAEDLLRRGLVAKSVNAPGSALATFEEFSYIGPTRKQAHTQIFGPLGIDFYLMGQTPEEAQALYYTFMKWHEFIAGAVYRSNEVDRVPRSDSTFFAIQYYDNYTTTAEFKVFSPQSEETPIIHNKYFEIYPQNVGQLSTSWESQDAPMTLSVEFEFYYMQSGLR